MRRLLRYPLWDVGLLRRAVGDLVSAPAVADTCWLPGDSTKVFRADPFVLEHRGRTALLYEEFVFATWRGRISYAVLDPQGSPIEGGVAIEADHHLSYPFLLAHQGEAFCIPETYQRREVAIQRALDFPRTWRKEAVLIADVAACDATVFERDGLWWLAATDRALGANSALCLWYAPDLFGPWRPHAANPVRNDLSGARPGGRPFVYEGQLYRPGQDCSAGYGGGVVLNRVTRLNPLEFSEEPAGALRPDPRGPYAAGLHTLSWTGAWTAIDGLRWGFSAPALASTLRRAPGAVLGRALSTARRCVPRPREGA